MLAILAWSSAGSEARVAGISEPKSSDVATRDGICALGNNQLRAAKWADFGHLYGTRL